MKRVYDAYAIGIIAHFEGDKAKKDFRKLPVQRDMYYEL